MLAQTIPWTVPAALSLPNILTGTGIEFVGRASNIDLLIVADQVGQLFGLTYTVGGDSKVMVPPGSSINLAQVAGMGPLALNDFILQDYPIPAGAHLVLNISGANTNTGRARLVVKP
jgi:hypothetical protein